MAEGFELEGERDEGFSGAGRGVEDDTTHRPNLINTFYEAIEDGVGQYFRDSAV